ncbi:macrophage mannose receptor 1-like isoform X1 [Strongylocentrotus purpuratus]|uniref:C-type lectin domain-containing protein n=1 Tax=Strongylocentrotus purpuratus TaxID=7668 RepID=A0A7M7PL93_STRPU|nr:macrophage mannose receptor 1-like isoform X1 [Strongylocentrotus purpuratus]
MHLVSIGSQLEQDFLVSNLPDNSSEYWIGLDSVTWQDGSNLTYNRFRGYFYDFDEGGTYFVMYIPVPTYWLDDIISVDSKRNCICEKEGACNPGHVEFQGSCYHFSGIVSNYNAAKALCESLGMHLVYIGSQEEQDFLEIIQAPYIAIGTWIGLSDVTWLDGSSLTYANFGITTSTFDDGGTYFVMSSSSSFRWLDDDGSNLHYAICEKEGDCYGVPYTYMYIYSGSCYYVYATPVSFLTAKSFCETYGTHLVSIGSGGEQDFLVTNLPDVNTDYWIGLDSITWQDGSQMIFNSFKGYPDDFNLGGTCFIMVTWKQVHWFDRTADTSNDIEYYICEKEGVPCDLTQIEHDGSCYYFSPQQATYHASKLICESRGMHLVYIGSQEEGDFLKLKGPSDKNIWIGLSAVTWLDNSILTYANFGKTTSTFDDGGTCFVMNSSASFRWLDDDSSNQHYYICEKEVGTESSTFTPATSQGCTDVATFSSLPATDTTSATSTTGTSQAMATSPISATRAKWAKAATAIFSAPVEAHKRSNYFKMLVNGATLVDVLVRSSYTASTVIACGHRCLNDRLCSCFTYIAHERTCLLAESCPSTLKSGYEERPGAVTYST